MTQKYLSIISDIIFVFLLTACGGTLQQQSGVTYEQPISTQTMSTLENEQLREETNIILEEEDVYLPTVTSTAVAATVTDEGYNLFAPLGEKTTYLINEAGETVYTWLSDYRPGNAVYLLENGNLLRTGNTGSDNFSVGGVGGIVEEISADGTVVWSFEHDTTQGRLHHDIELLPNGNILMLAWELKTESDSLAAGLTPSLLGEGELWPDYIIEVDPDSNSIVWEWHVWDHLVQDYDTNQANYGVVAEHPELIDLNFRAAGPQSGTADWNHINAVDYNAEFDQIMLSVHAFGEIWIIDHSTTTTEAASHSGGNSGMGGDLLYRWGNPQTFDAGTANDQQLFVQHDAHWIPEGYPGASNILIFNNGRGRSDGNYSSVDEIIPPVDADGHYNGYGPTEPIWRYTATTPTDFFAKNISGAQRLVNGNTLICDGPGGTFFEVTEAGETVWEYSYGDQAIFRVIRYESDYAGLPSLEIEDTMEETAVFLPTVITPESSTSITLTSPIPDTGQTSCYDTNGSQISCPTVSESYFGQDANYTGQTPAFQNNGNGTISDLNTGLMWQQTADTDGNGTINASDKLSYDEAIAAASSSTLGGYDDWRLPTVTELYSLIDFSGTDPSGYNGTDTSGLTPFIDTDYFIFGYGDTDAGERIIDAQYASSTKYVSTTMNGNETMFGVNFADGRIKGYPTAMRGSAKEFYVIFVRGNTDYDSNDFVDNGNGTISDNATGLMWQQDDSVTGYNWSEALTYCESLATASYDDWRLPNVKELQSLVDYGRSPDTTNSAAIDPLFNATQITNEAGNIDYAAYWSSTTHANLNSGANSAYLNFGRSMGYMNGSWLDVHGAGAQRSDPKMGDPANWPTGHGPQGDAIRIYNTVRCVRDGDVTTNSGGSVTTTSNSFIQAQSSGEQPDANTLPANSNQAQPPAAGTGPLADAAAQLGITEKALHTALGEPGQGPPDFAAAAATLGVTEAELMAALGTAEGGMPPGDQPPTNTP